MILTRDKGQRMWGGGGGSSYSYGGGGGGESPSFDGFVSNEYYNQNFELLYKQEVTAGGTTTTTFMTAAPNIIVPVGTVTDETTQTTTVTSLVGPVAKNAIVLGNIMMVYDQTNNAIKVVNRDGSTAANFYATGGVSALGYNPGGGGGGGADLNALLDNINSSNIGDIAPTASEVGKCLVYNGNNTWAWATPGGGGGLTYGLSWSYGSVSGAQGGSYDGSATKSFIIPKDTSHLLNGAGFITSAALSGYLPLTGGTMTGSIIMKGVNIYMDPADSSSNATPDIVFRYGNGSEKARIWVDDTFSSALGPQFRIYKTDGTQIVSTRLALASQIPSLVGYATQQWVNNQGFLTEDQYKGTVTSVKMTVPTGFSISGSPITSSGTLALGFANGYSLPTTAKQSNWETAYSWGNHANAGYMLRTEGMKFEARTGYLAARLVLADGSTYDSTRAALAQGSGYIEWWSTGGFFNHWMGNVIIGQDATDSTHYIQIGGGRIYWDNTSKSLYVVQADGSTAANFYATGGVSALGISTGGSPSVSALTVGTLTASSQLNVGGTSSFTGAMTANAMTVNGNISATNWQIPTTGYARFARLYLDSTRYVYVSNSHLYFYNGSSSIQIV